MNKTIKNLLSTFTVALFFLLAVASNSIKHMTFTKEGGQIPPEFGNNNDTLLVVNDGTYFGYLEKNFKRNYFGNYKIIYPDDLAKYPVEKYRFVFDHNQNYSSATHTTNSNGNTPGYGGTTVNTTTTSHYSSSDVFVITDRQTNKTYHTKSSASYSKLMRAYIKALEEARKK